MRFGTIMEATRLYLTEANEYVLHLFYRHKTFRSFFVMVETVTSPPTKKDSRNS